MFHHAPGQEEQHEGAEDDAGGVEDADEGEDSGGEVFGCVVEAGEGGGVSSASAGDDFVDAEFDFGEGEVFVVAGVVGEDAAGDGGASVTPRPLARPTKKLRTAPGGCDPEQNRRSCRSCRSSSGPASRCGAPRPLARSTKNRWIAPVWFDPAKKRRS